MTEQTDLKRMTRQEVGRVSQRAQMIRLSAQHRRVPEIATIFGVSRATVRFWIRQFEAEGPAGLYDVPRSGRPRQLTAAEQMLQQVIIQDPHQVHASYLATCWTVAIFWRCGTEEKLHSAVADNSCVDMCFSLLVDCRHARIWYLLNNWG